MRLELEKSIHYTFQNPDLLIQSLTHKSFFHEKRKQLAGDNEKLEFLGDAVLDLILSEVLLGYFPKDSEGNLSKKRASLVNEDLLSKVAIEIGIPQFLLLGKGEAQSGGLQKPRLLASALEAVVGAIFLDSNYEMTKSIVLKHFLPIIQKISTHDDFEKDYKTKLQEMTQKKYREAPVYVLSGESGPSHEKVFTVSLLLSSQEVSQACGKSKKQAEQEAARLTIEKFNQIDQILTKKSAVNPVVSQIVRATENLVENLSESSDKNSKGQANG